MEIGSLRLHYRQGHVPLTLHMSRAHRQFVMRPRRATSPRDLATQPRHAGRHATSPRDSAPRGLLLQVLVHVSTAALGALRAEAIEVYELLSLEGSAVAAEGECYATTGGEGGTMGAWCFSRVVNARLERAVVRVPGAGTVFRAVAFDFGRVMLFKITISGSIRK